MVDTSAEIPSWRSKISGYFVGGINQTGTTNCFQQLSMPIINTDSSFPPPGTQITIRPPVLNCKSPNIVYLIYCNQCNMGNYVGEIGLAFRSRMNNHKSSIINNLNYPVSGHFNTANHTINDFRSIIIGCNYKSTQERRNAEMKWIFRLKTHIKGLNKDLGSTCDYAFIRNHSL